MNEQFTINLVARTFVGATARTETFSCVLDDINKLEAFASEIEAICQKYDYRTLKATPTPE